MEPNASSRQKTTPRDFFLHLFATAALYFSAINLIALVWQYVNYFFPNPLINYAYDSGLSGTMRLAVAFLIIVFPAYVLVMWLLGRDIDRNPEKRDIWVRRWSIHLTLFISGVTILGDLVYLVYSLLGGDLTTRFILQALGVLIVAAAVFSYYLFLLRREPGTNLPARRGIVIASLAIVGVLVVGAFFIIGSPLKNRQRAWDVQRVNDLSSIQSQIVYYWQQKQELPRTLEDLKDPLSSFITPNDPETKQPYGYSRTDDKQFQLCASFDMPSDTNIATKGLAVPTSPYGGSPVDENWQHPAGNQCFLRTIDPQRYPPLTNMVPPSVR